MQRKVELIEPIFETSFGDTADFGFTSFPLISSEPTAPTLLYNKKRENRIPSLNYLELKYFLFLSYTLYSFIRENMLVGVPKKHRD